MSTSTSMNDVVTWPIQERRSEYLMWRAESGRRDISRVFVDSAVANGLFISREVFAYVGLENCGAHALLRFNTTLFCATFFFEGILCYFFFLFFFSQVTNSMPKPAASSATAGKPEARSVGLVAIFDCFSF